MQLQPSKQFLRYDDYIEGWYLNGRLYKMFWRDHIWMREGAEATEDDIVEQHRMAIVGDTVTEVKIDVVATTLGLVQVV